MGTGISGRYYTTHGSRKIHHKGLIHSFEGNYVFPKNQLPRLRSGGHGQATLDYMDKMGIAYNIEKTFPNGVRLGNIPNAKDCQKRAGSFMSFFPKEWTTKDIVRAAEHVVSLKQNRGAPDGKLLFGTWKGVRVCVMKTNGIAGTIFPDSKYQPKPRKNKKRK